MSKTKKRYSVSKHGNQWIDTSTPVICPECGEIVEHKSKQDNWCSYLRGTIKVKYEWYEYTCSNCKCSFEDTAEYVNTVRVIINKWKVVALIIFLLAFIYIGVAIFYGVTGRGDACCGMMMILFVPLSIPIVAAIGKYFDW